MASETKIELSINLLSDYLKSILSSEDDAINAVGYLIQYLHNDKEVTISYIIKYPDINKVLLQLFMLLQSSIPIIVGNAAFILGTLAENDEGRSRIIGIMSTDKVDGMTSLDFFVSLLGSCDTETVMNVAGTLGTLVETTDGRNFVISHLTSFHELLKQVNVLLSSDYLWTSSNAALILARLSIDVVGNSYIINNPHLDNILRNLIECLTFDEAGRGMNAAFALGRIFDNEDTIKRFQSVLLKHNFVEKLVTIADSKDSAFMKNSCFCLSSVMDSTTGYELVVSSKSFARLISILESILLLLDDEAVWFCVLTLKSICVRIKGCRSLKKNSQLKGNVNTCLHNPFMSSDVKRQCKEILEYLSPLEKPYVPCLTLISPHEVHVSWVSQHPKNAFNLQYNLYYKLDKDEILAYRGKKCEVELRNLEANARYEFYLNTSNEIETSESSDTCIVTMEEDYSSEPRNLAVLTTTATQVKISWDAPECPNGVVKYYHIHLNNGNVEQTTEKMSIISGLHPETKYTIKVFAINGRGKGSPAEIMITTLHSGAHAPDRPNVVVLGRSEMHLTWFPPEVPMGRIFRYDVKQDKKKVIYSGTNTYCKVTNLRADTDYAYSVLAVTSLGKYESPVCRRRTTKDEYASPHREPLYISPSKSETADLTLHSKVRSQSLAHDQSLHGNGLSPINNNPRRNSEYGPQKLLSTRHPRIFPLITTSRTSILSTGEMSRLSDSSPIKTSSPLINDGIVQLKGSNRVDVSKLFHSFPLNNSCTSIPVSAYPSIQSKAK